MFILDHSIDIIVLAFLSVLAYNFYKEHFARGNKMSDEIMMERYIELRRKGKIK